MVVLWTEEEALVKRWVIPAAVLLVFALLLWYVLRVDRLGLTSQDSRNGLLEINPNSVDGLVVTGPDVNIEIRRKEQDGFEWWLEPQHIPANEIRLEYLLVSLAGLRADTVANKQENLPAFGLDPPVWQLKLSQSGKPEQVLSVGEPAPVAREGDRPRYYASVDGRPDVLSIESWVVDQLGGGPDDWRDRYLCSLSGGEITSVEVRLPDGQSIFLRRVQNRWLTDSPPGREVDNAASRTLINRILYLEALHFVSDSAAPEQLSEWQLDQPVLSAVLSTGGIKPLFRKILVGREAGGKPMRYAKIDSKPWVFLVDTEAVNHLEDAARELLKL